MTKNQIIAAYVMDRAQQYDQGSGIVAALYQIAKDIRHGEADQAFQHGELDDILEKWRPREPGEGEAPL